jgi:hypothetical protein
MVDAVRIQSCRSFDECATYQMVKAAADKARTCGVLA